uniref:Membrane protein, palmitoylated 3a (MAGUK p55 subfamily member 3) n=1 Tax=Esox lucius TaxID=8010 RepID=A0AAY5K6K0_ESOLU
MALLTSQLRPDANHKEDMVFLKDIFSEKSLGYLMKIHEKLRQYERQSPTPVLHSAASLAEDVAEELQSGPMSVEEKELLQLLTSPHLKAVLSVHDTVAQKNFDPVLPPLPDDFEDELDEESVKIVRLVKNKEPLGATIRRDESTGSVIVARIMRGGAADRSGLVHVGDELREVNGISIIHKRPDEISQLLSQSQGSITLKIIPAIKEEDHLKESKVYMRAMFDYIPAEDKATPCQEAGLPFKRGDILQVVTQDDPTWWQAKRVGDSNLRAGLIPSKLFQERARSPKPSILPPGVLPSAHPLFSLACPPTEDCDCEGYFNGQYIAGLRRSFRLSRKDRSGSPGGEATPDPTDPDFATYEEVTRYQHRPNERPRLVVLIGKTGLETLCKFKTCHAPQTLTRITVSADTTRPKKPHEKEGVEYHFVTKQAFDTDTLSNKFIEHGEYKENQYGTSIEAIRSVQAKNKMCIVDVQPEVGLGHILPPFLEHPILSQCIEQHCLSHHSQSVSQPFRGGSTDDEDLQEMRQSAQQMDQQYGHMVDRVLIKEDSASACAELRGILERLERETFWVPLSWVRT